MGMNRILLTVVVGRAGGSGVEGPGIGGVCRTTASWCGDHDVTHRRTRAHAADLLLSTSRDSVVFGSATCYLLCSSADWIFFKGTSGDKNTVLMVVLESKGMLTAGSNQYLQPDYLSPLPTTVRFPLWPQFGDLACAPSLSKIVINLGLSADAAVHDYSVLFSRFE